jgi:DoxX-like family
MMKFERKTNMKKTRIFYWIVTGLFLLMMLFSGISSLVSGPKAVEFFKMLELPAYLISFLSVAKILGVIVVLIPGFPRAIILSQNLLENGRPY